MFYWNIKKKKEKKKKGNILDIYTLVKQVSEALLQKNLMRRKLTKNQSVLFYPCDNDEVHEGQSITDMIDR